jgi:hypothetical protein
MQLLLHPDPIAKTMDQQTFYAHLTNSRKESLDHSSTRIARPKTASINVIDRLVFPGIADRRTDGCSP